MATPTPIDTNAPDPWPYRPRFRVFVDQWLEAHPDKKRIDLALALEISPGTLKQNYSGRNVPGKNQISRMALIFGCSISDLWNDTGAEIAGQSTSDMSDKRRFLSQLMFDGIKAEDLSDEDAQFLYEDFLMNLNRLRAMKARMVKSDGGA